MGLDLAKAIRNSSVVIHSDSQFIVRHINGDYKERGMDEGIPKHGQRKGKSEILG